jgi:hypothetical protein
MASRMLVLPAPVGPWMRNRARRRERVEVDLF